MTNIVITGFMGTGKTTVGREVARRLDRSFVDMDAEIEARTGKSIPCIFAEDGEGAFRQMENELCKELRAQQGKVIATGGGALVSSSNRALMMKGSTVICLTCTLEQLLCRVNGTANPDRPLLDAADLPAAIERLLGVRSEAYTNIPWQIDTTDLTVEEAAARVIGIANAITLPVRYPNDQCNIHIGNGLLEQVGAALRATCMPEDGHVAVVSNPVVAPIYGTQVEEALRSSGFLPFSCTIPDGEHHKTLVTLAQLYEQFLAGGLNRGGTVISLGGGVTGDVAGFAAATFMRGVRFIQLPTTLLAMVDASVGGKTGVDLPLGKNLVGAFKQPALVIIDPNVLLTLPAEEIRSGLAEVIKHGVIADPDLLAELAEGDYTLSSWWEESATARITRALRVKIDLVEEDPLEGGRRALLNLGHTVGHALEKASGFSLRHGEAISIGMVAAARVAGELGRASPSLADYIEAVLIGWDLPVRCPPFDADNIWQTMAYDKKKRGQVLRWGLPRAIGEVEISEDVPPSLVKSVLCDMGAKCEK